MTIARHVRVTGHVQGVFFRQWTTDQARELGVSGWIRNCRDGTVEAHLQGDEEAVGRLIARMRLGPPAARVDDLTAEGAQPEGSTEFRVLRG